MDISTIINVVTTQCRRYYINLLMNVFAFMNVSNPQQHWYCDIFFDEGALHYKCPRGATRYELCF